ncbi:accessory factor UbiK family protein [Falsiroseomonas selenitidurans]|uniref:Accessory factor UbiK family protein n=1 Tax=Falsiroseomonas selenitidurans TaxID=2716335 RepID=A0ABX1DYL9_9PROT|nr:accessory factor UbiK family protein [Falsiroseomonas selenitidurans]NKC30017.1 accessory factor UbiK family protein [Falsiroseomonas selenitidurans]
MGSETGQGGGGGPGSGGGAGGGAGGPGPKRGLFDDLAGMAGGAFSVLAGARAEAEAMGRAQLEAMIQRFDLVRREDLDAALEVARRAREQAEALEARVAALESKLAAPAEAAPVESPPLAGLDEGAA